MSLEKVFNQVYNIPSIPKVVQDLLDDFANPNTQSQDIAKKIQLDPSLALKTLRLANSARYGTGRNIPSIDSAVIMLGIDTLKTLVVASGLTSACKNIPGLNQKEFWRSAFAVANITKTLCRLARIDPETGFTCGLLHNIGDALLFLSFKDDMTLIETQVKQGANKYSLQIEKFGSSYIEVGAELAKRWNFPDKVRNAIAQQLQPDVSDNQPNHAVALHLSVSIYKLLEQHIPLPEVLSKLPIPLMNSLGVDGVALLDKLMTLLDQPDDIDSLLG